MDTVPTSTLLVADEFPLIRDGISRLCESSGRYRALPACDNGDDALRRIIEWRPDLALLDYHLPRLPSLEVVRRAREVQSHTRTILIASRADRKMALESLRAGASGFLLKSADQRELMDALSRVESGSIYVSPQLEFEKVFLGQFGRSAPLDPVEMLSSREYQVFQLMADGLRAKEIASKLQLSPKTVDTYRASMMRKLNIHDVATLVRYAIQREIASAL